MYIAHVRKVDLEEQPLSNHLINVANGCKSIGEKFQLPSVFYLVGLLHDLGKYSNDFQNYIREAVNNPDCPPRRGSVDHSTAGGLLLIQLTHQLKNKPLHIMIEMLANTIYSHHGQLYDYVNLDGESPYLKRSQNEKVDIEMVSKRFYSEVMTKEALMDCINRAAKEFLAFLKKHLQKPDEAIINYKIAPPLTMMLFSALIDADRTDSRKFDENQSELIQKSQDESFLIYAKRLEENLESLQKTSINNEITKLRQEMSNNCLQKSSSPTGIYSLSIPTGGGKTLASLRFALHHAIHHKLDRIIYIVPFTTIIEQNAQVVRGILNTENILEHHSNVIDVYKETPSTYNELQQLRALHLAKDNWDMPIVFTTMVQYLNTFYSGKSRNLRRLHNLANAVIIFDEVQAIPIKCVSLFNESLNFLTKYASTTAVLCTATQPALQYVKKNIKIDGEVIDNLPQIEKAFKRTNVQFLEKKGGWKTEDLSDWVHANLPVKNSVLIITNNKKTARDLYKQCQQFEYVYHLSTSMCPKHRKIVLKNMSDYIKAGKQVLCISTQLIEAGVDVSFRCVLRSLAGVDSIAQAAGRCNRNGEEAISDVYVFEHAEENVSRLPTIEKGQRVANYLLRDIVDKNLFDGELLSSAAITHYFKQYYSDLQLELDFPVKNIPKTLYTLMYDRNSYKNRDIELQLHAAFRTVSENFEVIEANTVSIIVPYKVHGEEKSGEDLIAQLTSWEKVDFKSFMNDAQQYSVNVFTYEFELLKQQGLIRPVDFGVMKLWVAAENAYDQNIGLSVQGEAKLDLITI